ncbi:EAL domain-containing protein [Bacillus sp. AFS037270]|uniref:EAL domain-containing protein n=1 Tax=Bacillus sp. AFS037270 TaxID=2033499 RepID=UPI000BFB9314|nr:EAL domain-containing protein [Bacillus sp. AFS037270]PGV48375.1 hypothetical protein COD92_26645 [Bacillus sp. AFS037270]
MLLLQQLITAIENKAIFSKLKVLAGVEGNYRQGKVVKPDSEMFDMGRNLNFTVITEGVESTEHAAFLRKNKCFVGQGYLFSKPLPVSELESFLVKKAVRIS